MKTSKSEERENKDFRTIFDCFACNYYYQRQKKEKNGKDDRGQRNKIHCNIIRTKETEFERKYTAISHTTDTKKHRSIKPQKQLFNIIIREEKGYSHQINYTSETRLQIIDYWE